MGNVTRATKRGIHEAGTTLQPTKTQTPRLISTPRASLITYLLPPYSPPPDFQYPIHTIHKPPQDPPPINKSYPQLVAPPPSLKPTAINLKTHHTHKTVFTLNNNLFRRSRGHTKNPFYGGGSQIYIYTPKSPCHQSTLQCSTLTCKTRLAFISQYGIFIQLYLDFLNPGPPFRKTYNSWHQTFHPPPLLPFFSSGGRFEN